MRLQPPLPPHPGSQFQRRGWCFPCFFHGVDPKSALVREMFLEAWCWANSCCNVCSMAAWPIYLHLGSFGGKCR